MVWETRQQERDQAAWCATFVPMSLNAATLIRTLNLKPHPEGGHYAETFRSDLTVQSAAHGAVRAACTAICFLLERDDFSALHRVRSDEVWHHYLGDALELSLIHGTGALQQITLGKDLLRGQVPQAVAPRDVLQGARPDPNGEHGFVLVGCTVSPGFDFADFEMPTRADLSAQWPEHAALIASLTR